MCHDPRGNPPLALSHACGGDADRAVDIPMVANVVTVTVNERSRFLVRSSMTSIHTIVAG